MSYLNWTATIVALFPLAIAVGAQDNKDHDPLFASHDTLEVEVEAPFAMLTKERPDEEEVAGKFRFTEDDGSTAELDIVVRTRGHYRRNRRVCTFPPLRFNFRKSQTKNTLFDKQDKLKLVTHCRNNSLYDQTVLAEYLAYRILNLLTDTSFRARLLRVTYLYTDDDREVESYAILIEHKDRLGKRINGKPLRIENARVSELRPQDLNLASVFQYLLGNTDFSPISAAPDEDCCHNQALFASKDGLHYTVPFDFDQSGLVNAPHASPNSRFGLQSVRQRLYRGRCIYNNLLPVTMQLFRDHKDDIEALVQEQEELAPPTRRHMQNFIERFYETINKPRRVKRSFIKKCI
jgi:hypothetical protein